MERAGGGQFTGLTSRRGRGAQKHDEPLELALQAISAGDGAAADVGSPDQINIAFSIGKVVVEVRASLLSV